MADVKINLTNSNRGVYYAGDTVMGTVDLTLNSNKTVNGFYLKFTGKAKADWSTGSGKSRQHYEGREYYLDQKTYLFGHEGSQPTQMSAGYHRYDFVFPLPSNIPASLNLSHGSIQYFVEACLDIPWAFDKKFKTEITVQRKDDFNNSPAHTRLQRFDRDIDACGFFNCADGMISAVVKIPYSVFTPSSTIPISVNLNNKSNRNVEITQFKLQKFVKYHSYKLGKSSFSTKEKKYDIATCTKDGVRPSEANVVKAELRVPPNVETSNSSYCKVVQISYILNIKILSGKIKIPLIISIVPLNLNETSSVASTLRPEMTSSHIEDSHHPALNFARPDARIAATAPPLVPSSSYMDEIDQPALNITGSDEPPTFDEAMKMPKFEKFEGPSKRT